MKSLPYAAAAIIIGGWLCMMLAIDANNGCSDATAHKRYSFYHDVPHERTPMFAFTIWIYNWNYNSCRDNMEAK